MVAPTCRPGAASTHSERGRGVSAALRAFLALVAFYSVWDYIDHVSRAESWFAAHPLRWLGFTVTAAAALIGAILLVRSCLGRLTGRSRFLPELAAVAAGPVVHVYFSGPLADRLFGSETPLIFLSPWPLIALFATGFSLVYAATTLLRRLRTAT